MPPATPPDSNPCSTDHEMHTVIEEPMSVGHGHVPILAIIMDGVVHVSVDLAALELLVEDDVDDGLADVDDTRLLHGALVYYRCRSRCTEISHALDTRARDCDFFQHHSVGARRAGSRGLFLCPCRGGEANQSGNNDAQAAVPFSSCS